MLVGGCVHMQSACGRLVNLGTPGPGVPRNARRCGRQTDVQLAWPGSFHKNWSRPFTTAATSLSPLGRSTRAGLRFVYRVVALLFGMLRARRW